jgi:hypothetical protein
MTDRVIGVTGAGARLNVRRLMYQSLIWSAVPRDEAGRLAAPLDAQDVQCLADALVDGVMRDIELGGDFLGGQMLVDELQALELTRTQPRDAFSHPMIRGRAYRLRHDVRILQCNPHPAQHRATPEQQVCAVFMSFGLISPLFGRLPPFRRKSARWMARRPKL